ncbi:ankyrin repeat domain-containing protein [Mucilaginibacter sp. dw_454]|uniref:ankyrin repeat domain-containing protein n=1 Tax=Mucilaginibacter sp. dw_454 TaxID=2720079 RepID=UPI001BD5182B|nr:ankyrin repeat domain-containing protein [Mucilaginibacter sp. dw_454]
MKFLSPFGKLEQSEINDFKNFILENKYQINSVDSENTSSLQIAIVHGNYDLARFLVDNGIDVNIQDIKKNTALHYCAVYNQYEIAKYILEYNGKLNIQDKYGNEPLWTAVFNVRKDLTGMDVLELFLKNGADKNHKNKVDKSPASFANELNFLPIIDLMKKYD